MKINKIYNFGRWTIEIFHWGITFKVLNGWFHISWKTNEGCKFDFYQKGLTVWFSSDGGAPERSKWGWRLIDWRFKMMHKTFVNEN